MKKNKQKIKLKKEAQNRLMIAAASLAILAGLYGAGVATANFNSQRNREGMVQMLSEKFNLNKSEVEEALREYQIENQSQRQAEMKARLEARLSKAVEEDRITDKQKELVLAKREEMQNKISQDVENWSENREERIKQMEGYREEMRIWAEENGIEAGLVGLKGMRKGR